MDVRDVLPTLDVPTLVQHRTRDMIVPIELGRELATMIPGATLIEYDSADHFSYVGDLDPWMADLERFVTGTVRLRPEPQPYSATRIMTLGRFAVFVGDDEVPKSAWGSRHARQICKRLVAARGWPVTRDELIDMQWPDEHDRHRLSARLSVQLSTVRKVLGGGVNADRESVRLDLDEVTTDLEAFYEASDDAAIVAAYAGEFLPEDRYEDWPGAVRDEARSRFVAAARRQAAAATAEGRPEVATQTARRLVEEDRYDETAHRLLVEALLGAGQEGEARRAHHAWAGVMAELDSTVPSFDEVAGS